MTPHITLPDERKRILAEAEHNANEAKVLIATIEGAFQEAQKILPINAVKAHYRNGICKPAAYEIVTDRLRTLLNVPTSLRERFAAEDRIAKQHEQSTSPTLYRANPTPENRIESAVIYLLQAGKQLGLDFHLTNAIQMADEVAEFDFIQLSKMTQKPIRFQSAAPCKNDCKGWNPRHQTCICGQNRLRWQRASTHCFEQPNLLPIATKSTIPANTEKNGVGKGEVELVFQVS